MLCAGCNKPLGKHNDEVCHISFDTPKTYEQYVLLSLDTNRSIMKRHGAPAIAKPPGTRYYLKPVDYEYRKNLWRKMNPGGEYKRDQA